MPRFLITFKDGSSVEKTADTGDHAKAAAKHQAARETGATEKRDPRVAVASVERIGE